MRARLEVDWTRDNLTRLTVTRARKPAGYKHWSTGHYQPFKHPHVTRSPPIIGVEKLSGVLMNRFHSLTSVRPQFRNSSVSQQCTSRVRDSGSGREKSRSLLLSLLLLVLVVSCTYLLKQTHLLTVEGHTLCVTDKTMVGFRHNTN